MGLLYPVTVKLRADEADAINSLVAQEPLISRAEALIGASIMGLSVAAQPDGFQRLLGILRNRRQGEEVLAPKKPVQSAGSGAAPTLRRRPAQGKCA